MSASTQASDKKTIAITGVSRGIGRAAVELLLAQGHTVAGCARSAPAMGELAQLAGDRPHRFDAVDVAHVGAVRRWVDGVLADFGAPDLVVANAGLINRPAKLWELSAEEVDRVIDVNVLGVVHVLQGFLPAMIEAGRGVVVALSSGWGRSTAPDVAPYCASKYAVEGLIGALAQELPPGLAAVALNPGIIDTEMLRSAWQEGAAAFPDPQAWAATAVPFLLGLGPDDNGASLTAP